MPNNITLEELMRPAEYAKPKHEAYTQYVVDGETYEVPTWSHPAVIANHVLNVIQHTKYFGLQIIAPPGSGKTSIAKVIAHHIHKKDESFEVRLEKENETQAFEHLDNYINTLPKKPTIVIFDDLSGVFGKMKDEDIDRNFDTLTRVRWILDPATGKIPFIPILTYHYSKIVEKKFRSQNGMSIFCSFGNEEKTNMDSIAPKKTQGRRALTAFQYVYQTMFPKHFFNLLGPDNRTVRYETDKPFRASCMIADNRGAIIVTSHKDVCEKCDVTSKKMRVPEEQIIQEVITAHGIYGLQQLRQAIADRGYQLAINPRAFIARKFIEDKILPRYAIDYDKLWKGVYKFTKTGIPKKVNRKRKQEREIIDRLDNAAFFEDDVKADTDNPGELKLE